MKFIFDKVANEPFNSLSKSDVKILLQSIPEEWLNDFSIIRFQNAIHGTPGVFNNRPVQIYNNTLSVWSRGIAQNAIIREILIELAQKSGDLGFRERSINSLSSHQLKLLAQHVEPLAKNIEDKIVDI